MTYLADSSPPVVTTASPGEHPHWHAPRARPPLPPPPPPRPGGGKAVPGGCQPAGRHPRLSGRTPPLARPDRLALGKDCRPAGPVGCPVHPPPSEERRGGGA